MVLGTGKQSLVDPRYAVDSKHPSYSLLGLSNRFNRRYDLAPSFPPSADLRPTPPQSCRFPTLAEPRG